MEQELKSDKFKSNSNKGYVFTLMPLYAIGVGVFAAYKFLKVSKETFTAKFHLIDQYFLESVSVYFYTQIKSADDQAQKDNFAKGAKKSVEAGVSHMCCCRHVCAFVCSNICLSNLSSPSCVCLFICREPAERAGTKTRPDWKDAQFHPHAAGPAH